MTIEELIAMATARVTYLSQLRADATRTGDVQAVARADAEIAETQSTLSRLKAA